MESLRFPFAGSFQPHLGGWRRFRRPWVSSSPQALGFADSSISLDFRIRKHASKHPWLCFGSFSDVLIQFRSPWQAQARRHVLVVLNQPRVFGRRLEVAGQGKAGRNP